jgi:preprotein translocase subunit YajC
MQTFFLLWQNGGGSIIWSFLPILFMIAIFYFILIRPQQRRQQELQQMVTNLKIGDTVVTNGGLVGKILELREKSLIIRSADKSNLEITRSAVIGKEVES